MTIVSGTADARSEHRAPLAATNLALSMVVPVALAIIGIALHGWGAIDWAGAIVWGIVATAAFTAFSLLGRAIGMTRMDLLDLLGSVVAPPGSTGSRAVGAVMHHANGALLAIAWAYGAALIGAPTNWLTGLVWAGVLWVLALLMMTSLGAFHPAIRRGAEPDPGPAATNFGAMTPVGSLLGHAVYGLVLGFAYQNWPLT